MDSTIDRIRPPEHFLRLKTGETEILAIRHGEYEKNQADSNSGKLTSQGEQGIRQNFESIIADLISNLSPEERSSLDFMIISSPTRYFEGGQRSMETAQIGLDVLRAQMKIYNLSENQLVNNQSFLGLDGGPIPSAMITEPKIFENNLDFVNWLKTTFGRGVMNQAAWAAFESDGVTDGIDVRAKRIEMQAEGPKEVAARLERFLGNLGRFALRYHLKKPGRRLAIIVVTHYDTISPFLKSVTSGDPKRYLPVDYGGGFSIHLQSTGQREIIVNHQTIPKSPLELPHQPVKADTAS